MIGVVGGEHREMLSSFVGCLWLRGAVRHLDFITGHTAEPISSGVSLPIFITGLAGHLITFTFSMGIPLSPTQFALAREFLTKSYCL
jgi:hypothetical protein